MRLGGIGWGSLPSLARDVGGLGEGLGRLVAVANVGADLLRLLPHPLLGVLARLLLGPAQVDAAGCGQTPGTPRLVYDRIEMIPFDKLTEFFNQNLA